MPDRIQFRRVGEWTIVYLNGELARYGDSYLADEWLQERCGVEIVDDENNLCIPDGHTPLKTLAEVEAAERDHNDRAARADKLERQAAAMRAEAERIRTGAR